MGVGGRTGGVVGLVFGEAARMHTPLQRLNQLFMFAITLFAFQGFSAFWLAQLQPEKTVVDIAFNNIIVTPSKANDEAFVRFDLDADLTTAFTWNTKQLFVMVVAEYGTKTNARNEVVLWDDIITSEERALIQLKEVYSEYRFRDLGFGLRANNISLSLKWMNMPCSGTSSLTTK